MPHVWILAVAALLASAEGAHLANPVFRETTEAGLSFGGATVRLPGPTLPDGGDDRAAIRSVAGGERAVAEFLRDSVTAPFVLKTRDVPAAGATIRAADLWFVVHARLEDVDLEGALGGADGKEVEAGNMRFSTRTLRRDETRGLAGADLPPLEGRRQWYARVAGRLLDRIEVQATERSVATRSADSLVVATRAEPSPELGGRWATLTRKGAEEARGEAHPYPGGISYAKITRLPTEPGALLVEAHLAFVEPAEWFQGNPILRSKIGLIAQDQVRSLRREIARRGAKP